MAFEPIYEVAAMDSKQKLCSDQVVVEARMIPPPNVAISKILAISCNSNIFASEVFTGEVRYSGKVGFKILFVDAEGGNHSMDYNADFSDKLTAGEVTAQTRPMLKSKILDTDVINVSAGEVKLAAVVEVELHASCAHRVKYLARGGENIYTHDDRIDFSRLVADCTNTFSVGDIMHDIGANKLLMAEPKIVTLKRVAGEDSITIEGKAICDMVFETEDGMLVSKQAVTPFSQQTGATGTLPAHLVLCDAKLLSYSINFETDGEASGLSLEYNIELHANIFSDDVINPIVDAFSVTNELLSTTESLDIQRNKLCATIEDRVEGTVTLDINMPIVDSILAATASKLHISNAYALEGKIVLEGIANASILYYSAELNSKNSVSVELPFSLTLPCPVAEGDMIDARGEVTEIIVKIRRGNELDIKAEICVTLIASEKATKYVITELSMGEEIEIPDSAISIHIAKPKETLWEVAKALCTTPELVLLQNPNLTLPLSGGERIITYRHLTR